MNPGIAPSGLFWTIMLPEGAVKVHSHSAGAEMRASNVHVLDYGDIGNSLFGGRPPVPATVSFRVRWAGATKGDGENAGERVHVVNASDGHAGEYIRNTAQMEWSATTGDYDFVSAPIETSSSDFAEFGQERNGIFFRSGF
ncbi:MAG: hypothetical protein NVS4B3_20130 [Gemmatimonadaceae bacterium]